MVFKLAIAASKTCGRVKGAKKFPKLIAVVRFNAGFEVIRLLADHAA